MTMPLVKSSTVLHGASTPNVWIWTQTQTCTQVEHEFSFSRQLSEDKLCQCPLRELSQLCLSLQLTFSYIIILFFFSPDLFYFQPHSWQAFDLVPSYFPPPLSLSLSSRPGVCCPDRNEAFAVCGPTVHVPEEGEEIESRNVGGLTGRKWRGWNPACASLRQARFSFRGSPKAPVVDLPGAGERGQHRGDRTDWPNSLSDRL